MRWDLQGRELSCRYFCDYLFWVIRVEREAVDIFVNIDFELSRQRGNIHACIFVYIFVQLYT